MAFVLMCLVYALLLGTAVILIVAYTSYPEFREGRPVRKVVSSECRMPSRIAGLNRR